MADRVTGFSSFNVSATQTIEAGRPAQVERAKKLSQFHPASGVDVKSEHSGKKWFGMGADEFKVTVEVHRPLQANESINQFIEQVKNYVQNGSESAEGTVEYK